MRKTKVNRTKKFSKKTRKNKTLCEKGVTDEVLRLRKMINKIKGNNSLTKGSNTLTTSGTKAT
jgi:hypothetical protein